MRICFNCWPHHQVSRRLQFHHLSNLSVALCCPQLRSLYFLFCCLRRFSSNYSRLPFHLCPSDWRILMKGKISAAELRKTDNRIKKREDKHRRRYKAIHGRKVDFIKHWLEEDILFISIRFLDGTNFSIQYEPTVELVGVEYSDMSSGDDVILKQYYRRKGW